MDHVAVLVLIGLLLGTIGTLIGAGGGFILVPLLLLTRPELAPEVVTAISMAIVACNAVSGTIAYVSSRRIDYRAGLVFAVFTLPGSLLGPWITSLINPEVFRLIFGAIVIVISVYLFLRGGRKAAGVGGLLREGRGLTQQRLTDRHGDTYAYSYDMRKGAALSLLVGFISPILGIGGGIIHVPAMSEWLLFPVHIATATSHFVLAISTTITTVVHALRGEYNDPAVLKMVLSLGAGVITGAQIGARLSRRVKDKVIIRALAVCLAIVGVRILLSGL